MDLKTRLLANTTIPPSDPNTPPLRSDTQTSAVHETQLSPDGTCILSSTHSRALSLYIIPRTILTSPSPLPLSPYSLLAGPEPIWSFAVAPYFNLSDPTTSHILLSRRDSYITLYNPLSPTPTTPLSTYPLINPLHEALLPPTSLTYAPSGTHFLAGTDSLISLFSITHPSSPPLSQLRTTPSKGKYRRSASGYKGVITSLSLSPDSSDDHSILAAGTRSRWVALYDCFRLGSGGAQSEIVAVDLNTGAGKRGRGRGGNGVTGVKWSPCAKYLYIAERGSDVVSIYDVRNFRHGLGWCMGRKADTNQKLGIDVFGYGGGGLWVGGSGGGGQHEVWAGGSDGMLRYWRNPHWKEGGIEPDGEVEVGRRAVTGVAVHPCGAFAVVGTGGIEEQEEESESDSDEDVMDSETEGARTICTETVKAEEEEADHKCHRRMPRRVGGVDILGLGSKE
ncbi:hypothetical protein M011DRAFT_469553 [Sporormia fimetaria CBS 119925]|uniref:WD40 repeat-like protein n=1 Tax=Sporormia fimetaria CBS 119925 TaxID=1340428 RepID=A0A6A6V4L0_9PLEO|nr:hypothetical protein M011DRAFT_469553 [Sporormia fimetaria CBS 119925]